jgi:hypothetical protein
VRHVAVAQSGRRGSSTLAIRVRFTFHVVADFCGLFDARRRVQIHDQDHWMCNNASRFAETTGLLNFPG